MPRISLCMIVRDEAVRLPACLRSVADLVQEIIVVDTGSHDTTRDIARSAGAEVFEFPWADDFSAARNESLRHAAGDWIFWMDADELLDETNRARFRALAAGLSNENAAYRMQQVSPMPGGDIVVSQERLFRNVPAARWKNRVHETIALALQQAGHQTRATDIVISHTGYADPAAYRAKQERDLRLLEVATAENPRDAVSLYDLGRSQIGLRKLAEGIATLERTVKVGVVPPPVVRNSYRLRAARSSSSIAPPRPAPPASTAAPPSPTMPTCASSNPNSSTPPATSRPPKATSRNFSTPRQWVALASGITGYMAWQNLGAIYRRTDRDADAEKAWGAAVTEKPDFLPAWISLGELYAAHKHWPEAADAFQKAIAQGRPGNRDDLRRRAWRSLIRCHLESGNAGQALAVCRDGRAEIPDNADLCFFESQIRLSTGDLAGARRALEELLTAGHHWSGTDPAVVGYKSRQNLGVILMQQGHADEAEAQFRRVVAEQPTFVMAWVALADLYVNQRRWTEAETVGQTLESIPEGRGYAPTLRNRIGKAKSLK